MMLKRTEIDNKAIKLEKWKYSNLIKNKEASHKIRSSVLNTIIKPILANNKPKFGGLIINNIKIK